MKKILLTALTVVALAAGALGLTAFRHGGHRDPARMASFITHRVEDMLDDIRATDTQRQQILAIKDKLVADLTALRAGHGDVRKELLAQWQSDAPDAARIHALVAQRADGMKAFGDRVADALVQVHGILTPEQRAQVAKKLARHHADAAE